MMRASSPRRESGWALELSLKQAVRRLIGGPSFALSAIVTLALCLGVNATLLSFLVTLTWRPQPGVRDAGQLVHVTLHDAKHQLDYARPSELQALGAADARTIELASYAPTFASVSEARVTGERTLVEYTSPTFFELLHTRPRIGRLLVPRDSNATDLETPVVISQRLWQRVFANRPDIVGNHLYVDGRAGFVIVGVAEAGFHGPEGLVQADVWLPITHSQKEYGSARIIGRVHDGFDLDAVRAELGVIWKNVARQESARRAARGLPTHQKSLTAAPLRAGLHPEQSPLMQRLLGGSLAVGLLVLLIACVNLAGLTLSRVLSRGPEIAVRTALGSSRAQLWADIGVELAVLFSSGAGLGLLIAPLIGRMLVASLAQPFAFTLQVHLDPATLALSFSLTAIAVVIAALAPGLQAMRVAPANALRAESTSAGISKFARRAQGGFVVAQLSSAVLLVAAVVTAVITAGHILDFNLGVTSPETLLRIERGVSTSQSTSDDVSEQALERIRRLPSVISAVRAYQTPAGGSLLGARVRRAGVNEALSTFPDSSRDANMNVVSTGFFATIGAPVLRGRDFRASDDSSSPRVAVLSRSAAAQLFAGTDAIGQQLVEGDSSRRITVVGVVGDVLYDPTRPDDQRVIYLPAAQARALGERMILARVQRPVPSATRAIGASLDDGSSPPGRQPESIDQLLRDSTGSLRAIFALLLAASAVAVSLALTGIYGMVAYSAGRRRREIGVRLALGARPADVARVFLVGVMTLGVIAIVIACAAWPIFARILPDAMQADGGALWLAFLGASVTLGATAAGVALAATWHPAHVHPMQALRAD